ncbi:hypothetical protein [Streptomyces chartreusis]|uniref:hypothetical protein n=1 Tax=Streptomyces chartreusis TaxID=1969 RepID=UPI00366761B8
MDAAALDLLAPGVAEALTAWERQTGRHLGPFTTMDTGGSGALLFLAYVRDGDMRQRKRRMIVKLCSGDGEAAMEPGNHTAALRSRPSGNESFPDVHLVRQMYDPQRFEGSWLMFQEIAGRGDRGMTTLGALRRNQGLPEAVATVTRSLLEDWNPDEHGGEPMSAGGFVAELLDRRLEAGAPLRVWSHKLLGLPQTGAPWLCLPGSRTVPNPLDLGAGSPLAGCRLAYPVRGRAHGDLHPGNIMVPTADQAWSEYALIDLSRFSDHALLARDPAHLLLCIVADFLPEMSDGARTELLDLLVGRDTPALTVPHGLRQTLFLVREAPGAWLREHDIRPDWADQWLLSLQACALMFTARERYSLHDRWWFYLLAAEAAGAYLKSVDVYEASGATSVRIADESSIHVPHMPFRPYRADAEAPVDPMSLRPPALHGPDQSLASGQLQQIIREFEPCLPGIIQETITETLLDQAEFIAGAAALMRERLSGLTREGSFGPSEGNGWSLRQVVGHLRATEARAVELTAELTAAAPSPRSGIARRKLLEALEDLLVVVQENLNAV